MVDVQCRSLKDKKGLKDVTEKLDCSLNKGLVCNGKCSDYEVRVLCECKKEKSAYINYSKRIKIHV